MYNQLLPTWTAHREARAKRDVARAEWDVARAEWNEARAKLDVARAKRNEAYAKYNEAYAKWIDAVREVCGPDATIEWDADGRCLVQGVMLFTLDTN